MLERIVVVMLTVVAVYLVAGLLAAVALHVRGLQRFDRGVIGGGLLFRLLITPGLIALWPILLRRWLAPSGHLPGPGRPFTPVTLRRLHRVLTLVLVLVVPAAAAVAVLLRPAEPQRRFQTPDSEAPAETLAQVVTRLPSPFGALPVAVTIRSDGAEALQVELELTQDLELPSVMLFWTAAGPEAPVGSSVFLGPVWGPGRHRFSLPSGATEGGSLLLYSMAQQELVGSAELPPLEALPKSPVLLRPARKSRLCACRSPVTVNVSTDTAPVTSFASERTDVTFLRTSRRRYFSAAPLGQLQD